MRPCEPYRASLRIQPLVKRRPGSEDTAARGFPGFQDNDRRAGLVKQISCPQAGETGADDHNRLAGVLRTRGDAPNRCRGERQRSGGLLKKSSAIHILLSVKEDSNSVPRRIVERYMTRSRFIPGCLLLAAAIAHPTSLSAQDPAQLAGSWTLNRQLSQFPTDIGFSADFLGALGPGTGPAGGGRGGRRGGGGGGGGGNRGGLGAPRIVRETEEDSQRISTLTDEVRTPFDHLTIAVTPADVTITPDRAPARTLHTDGRDDTIPLGRVTSVTNTTWDAGRLVVVYKAGTGRQLRYVYSLNANPRQLIVEVEFVERGGGDKVRRVYEPMVATDTRATPASAPAAAAASGVPAAPATAASAPIDQRPDASLKGLTRLGLVLEGLSGDASACGLKQDALETTVSKHLSDAGFRVVRNSDEDTYMYVNINTAKASTGLCVSRYDVTIYSHAAARLPHTESPVLLQVELLHKGGLTGGAPATHADDVTKNVLEYVDQFSNRIRNAGK